MRVLFSEVMGGAPAGDLVESYLREGLGSEPGTLSSD
jgi:hypothetical protein